MFKKLLPAVMALALIATACGNHEGEGEAAPEENGTSMQEAAEPAEHTEEAAPAEETAPAEEAAGETMEHSEEAH